MRCCPLYNKEWVIDRLTLDWFLDKKNRQAILGMQEKQTSCSMVHGTGKDICYITTCSYMQFYECNGGNRLLKVALVTTNNIPHLEWVRNFTYYSRISLLHFWRDCNKKKHIPYSNKYCSARRGLIAGATAYEKTNRKSASITPPQATRCKKKKRKNRISKRACPGAVLQYFKDVIIAFRYIA